MKLTNGQLDRIYKDLSKNDTRCRECRYFKALTPGDDLGNCALEETRVWQDDHACYMFMRP